MAIGRGYTLYVGHQDIIAGSFATEIINTVGKLWYHTATVTTDPMF